MWNRGFLGPFQSPPNAWNVTTSLFRRQKVKQKIQDQKVAQELLIKSVNNEQSQLANLKKPRKLSYRKKAFKVKKTTKKKKKVI